MILLAAGCLSASAQQVESKDKSFAPHWYVQAQVGMQHTLGEVKTSSLNSFNAQVAGGYQFSKLLGARLTVGGYQSKGGFDINIIGSNYSWNYIAPTVDVTFNVTNAILGYNPNRLVDFSIFAGGGVNIAYSNDDANNLNNEWKSKYSGVMNAPEMMGYLWDGTKTLMVGQCGANIDFKVSDRVSLGIEANFNFTGDEYNSKRTKNADWYFNALAGLKVNL